MKAHSKSEYKRLVAMGADVEPPDAPMPERKLPVVYVVVDVDTGDFKSAHRTSESAERVAEVEHICDPRHEFEPVEYIPRAQANEARRRLPLLIDDRHDAKHDPLEVAEFLDSQGDRANEAVGEALHDAADVVRGMHAMIANEARRVTCGECQWYQRQGRSRTTVGYVIGCVHANGLSGARPCDWCSYAEPREAREDG